MKLRIREMWKHVMEVLGRMVTEEVDKGKVMCKNGGEAVDAGSRHHSQTD